MKTDQNISNDVLDIIKTSKDRRQFLSFLDVLTNSKITDEKDIDATLDTYLPYRKKDPFLKLFSTVLSKGISFQDAITEIKTIINNFPEVSVTLAFEPTKETINSISGWFLIHANLPVILDIHVDPRIIAGTIVAYKGKYMDF